MILVTWILSVVHWLAADAQPGRCLEHRHQRNPIQTVGYQCQKIGNQRGSGMGRFSADIPSSTSMRCSSGSSRAIRLGFRRAEKRDAIFSVDCVGMSPQSVCSRVSVEMKNQRILAAFPAAPLPRNYVSPNRIPRASEFLEPSLKFLPLSWPFTLFDTSCSIVPDLASQLPSRNHASSST